MFHRIMREIKESSVHNADKEEKEILQRMDYLEECLTGRNIRSRKY